MNFLVKNNSEIEIFQSSDGITKVYVTFENETVWLNQDQMCELFERDRTVIGRHIKNIFKDGELLESMVCANFAHTTIHGAIKGKNQSKTIKYYNLDVIISVGYRVKSKRGAQFRQWASIRLKEYLFQGYSINKERLEQKNQEIKVLKSSLKILDRVISERKSEIDFDWLDAFSSGLKLLDDYDHEKLDTVGVSLVKANYPLESEYRALINQMIVDFDTEVFGVEKDGGFRSSIEQITKGFGQIDFYPSIEEKAATLLYLIIKNHAFVDGNKRIAAACFLLFLKHNNILTNNNGNQIISNEALASMTLFTAASKPEEMEVVKNLMVSILNRNEN